MLPVRILLIDDNLPDRVRYRRMLLKDAGTFEIVEVEDGAGALAVLGDPGSSFDCVLLDQDLPDVQGLDLIDDIRQHPAAPPVVMLTGEEDAAVSVDALRRGAADYLMKRRIDEDRLKRAIHAAIDRTRLANQLHEQQLRSSLFYRLTNQTEDALFIVDAATMAVTDCNEAARNRLQLTPGSAADGATPAAFASPESWADFCGRAREDGSARYEWHTRQVTGTMVTMEILARCVEEAGHPYIVAVGRDVTLRKQREQNLVEQSVRDGLTGAWNRRAFDERLARAWHDAAAAGRPLALVMLDVDHFKAYNDSLGHQAGDACLRLIAQTLRNGTMRSAAMLARYGGEEFVALLEDCDAEAAAVVAERLRMLVVGLALPHGASSVAANVTVSVGAASLRPTPKGDSETLLAAADAALYRAKQAGRNRVVMHDPTDRCTPRFRIETSAFDHRRPAVG